MRRRSILMSAPALMVTGQLQAQQAQAQQDWPTRPVRIVVPFPPGNPADLAARLIGEKMSAAWGQPVVIDNVPGAAGTIGVARVGKATPDGYTLVLSGDAAAATNVVLMPNLGYDTRKDFAPIMQVGSTPNLLVVRKDLEAKNVQELIALARKQPGKLTYGSTGVGTSQHLCGEIFCQMAGVELVHVPYKEPYTNDLIAGRIDMGFANTVTSLQQARAGTIRAIAVSSAHRVPVAPDVPTVAEQGLAGFNVTPWFGYLAPAGTPVAIVAKVHAEAAKAIADPVLKAKLEERGFEIIANTPQQFADVLKTEIPRLAELIKQRGIKPQ
jgi:tripartite-type tricarboxylate transporter receptor subunit TctC